MVCPDEINTTINELIKSRYNTSSVNIEDVEMVRPPVGDLYEKAALYFLIPYLDFTNVNVTQETEDYEFGSGTFWAGTTPIFSANKPIFARAVSNHQANISLFQFANLSEYELITAVLNVTTKSGRYVLGKLKDDLFNSLRLYFDAHEEYSGRTPDGRIHFLEIIFQLARRGYLNLVEFLDELLKSDTIAGEVIIEIQKEIALIYPFKVEVADRFNL